jgi:hypothetical protein
MLKVLMLYGGLVGSAHGYFQTAARTLADASVPHLEAPIEGALPDDAGVAAVIVSDYGAYLALDEARRQSLDAYCAGHHAGLVFLYVDRGVPIAEIGATASDHTPVTADDTAAASPLLSLLKGGIRAEPHAPLYARHFPGTAGAIADVLVTSETSGVRHVFNGLDLLDHWLPKLALLDSVRWASAGAIVPSPDRWLAVDIDDIFQPSYDDDPAARTVKIQSEDVADILQFAQEFRARTGEEFHFTLGFNADYYGLAVGPAPYDDAAGDRALVANAAQFHWFDHFPAHEPATSLEQLQLEALMRQSKRWAAANGVLPYIGTYAVSPYHDGMVPPHEPLYQAWRNVWALETGGALFAGMPFVHDGIQIASRFDCGAPCNSAFFSFGQIAAADVAANADAYLVSHLASAPATILMTHQSDYARDRLALYMLRAALDRIAAATNLVLHTADSGAIVRRLAAH